MHEKKKKKELLVSAQAAQLTSSRISAHVVYPFHFQSPPHIIISSIYYLCLAAVPFIIGGDALFIGPTNQTHT